MLFIVGNHTVLLLCFDSSSSSSFRSLHAELPSVWRRLQGLLACSKSLLVPSTLLCIQPAVLFFLCAPPSPVVLRLQLGGASGLHHGPGAVSSESSPPGICQQRLHYIEGSGSAHCSRTRSAPLSTPGDHNQTDICCPRPYKGRSSLGLRVYRAQNS